MNIQNYRSNVGARAVRKQSGFKSNRNYISILKLSVLRYRSFRSYFAGLMLQTKLGLDTGLIGTLENQCMAGKSLVHQWFHCSKSHIFGQAPMETEWFSTGTAVE